MSLFYLLNKLYYQNQVYLYFGLFQLFFSFSLFCYLCTDFTNHIRDRAVVQAEALIFVLMLVDCLIYNLVHGFKANFLTLVEAVVLVCFMVCLLMVGVSGVGVLNGEIEVILLLGRFTLQIFRLFILVVRIRENAIKRNAATNLDMNVIQSTGIKETDSVKHFEISVI